MFARANTQHHQIAYITNDLNRAIALFENDYAAPGFFVFNNIQAGAGEAGGPELHIAIAHIGGVEIELIAPVPGTAPFFESVLTGDTALELCFHHVAIRIGGPIENWQAHIASIDTAKHNIVFQGALGDDLRFFYTDETARIGHYIEHVWLSPAMLAQIAAARPKFPADEDP